MKLNTASFDSTISFFFQGVTLEEESPLDISTAQVCYSNEGTWSKEESVSYIHLLKQKAPYEICNHLLLQTFRKLSLPMVDLTPLTQ